MVHIESRGRSGYKRERSRIEGNKVYVSNIDFGCTHQDIKDAFCSVGEVAFVEMLKDNNNKPKGCAIVRFKESNIADEAIRKMNRYELNGRKLVVKDERDAPRERYKDPKRGREDDYDAGPSTSSDKFGNTFGLSLQFLESLGIDGPIVNRVFVANLDYGVTEENLNELFSMAGKVVDIELVRGEDGKSKGFGFIEFEHPIEAVQAISMLHQQTYLDRPMSVQLTRKEKKRKEGSLKLPPGLKAVGMGLGINGTPLKDVARTIEAGQQSSLLGAMPLGSPNNMTVNRVGLGMGGLSANIGGAISSTNIGGGLAGNLPTAASIGGGLASSLGAAGLNPVLGSSLNSTTSALPSALNPGLGLMDRPNVGVGLGLDAVRNLPPQNIGGSGLGGGISGTPALQGRNTIVQISNLPPDYTWKSLQNLCQPFGEVSFAKITSRGVGLVHFENEASARRAVDMLDQQRFEGRFLDTRLI